MLLSLAAFAQGPGSPEEEKKKLDEAIDTQLEHLTSSLDLEDWQVFYIDSIMRHDFHAMREEVMELSSSRVANTDLYYMVQDKWSEKMYNAIQAVLNEEQWAKYLKSGAERDKKTRDKRAAKAAAGSGKK